MSIIRWLGGVTQADLKTEVQKAVTAALEDARPPEYDEVLSLAQQAAASARSAAQDADSAAHNATIATQALDAMNESLATHALTLAQIETNHDHTRADLRALTARVVALEGAPPVTPPVVVDPTPEPAPGRVPWSLTVGTNTPTPAAAAYLQHVTARSDNSGTGGVTGILGYASQADLYQLARPVRDTTTALVQALRATGARAYYDALDRIAETARASLRPGWRGVASASGQEQASDPPAPGGNGYIEPGEHQAGTWVWGASVTTPHAVHTGRSVHMLDGAKVGALVAQWAMVYHENQHLPGATGKRDFWLSWLDAWEKVWRSKNWRRGRPANGPIFNRSDGHVAHAEMLMYVHLHRMTGQSRFLEYANTLRDRYWGGVSGISTVSTPAGPALVWPRGSDTSDRILNPTTYARYYFADALELHAMDFGEYASPSIMRSFARTLTEFVLLPGLPSSAGQIVTARDVGGGTSRAGYPASPEASWKGLTTNVVTSWSCMPLYERWDDTGRLKAWNDAATVAMGYQTSPKGYALPIARTLAAVP